MSGVRGPSPALFTGIICCNTHFSQMSVATILRHSFIVVSKSHTEDPNIYEKYLMFCEG